MACAVERLKENVISGSVRAFVTNCRRNHRLIRGALAGSVTECITAHQGPINKVLKKTYLLVKIFANACICTFLYSKQKQSFWVINKLCTRDYFPITLNIIFVDTTVWVDNLFYFLNLVIYVYLIHKFWIQNFSLGLVAKHLVSFKKFH